MQDFGHWVDAHSHLADPRWGADAEKALIEARRLGIGFFLQGGIGPDDWDAQVKLKEKHPKNIGLCFGLHPYWVASHDEDLCEIALDSLAHALPKAMALGETGLDFRPHIMKESRELQLRMFEQQLEMCEWSNKPAVLHIVQAHDEALRLLDLWGVPKAGAIVHSFNGSAAKADDFIRRGMVLSVGGPVARPENEKLHQAVRQIPLEYLLIETDSPDQPPPAYAGERNPPASLWDVAKAIADIRKVTPAEILDITASNFRRIFHVEEPIRS